ncbi:MAG: hypothetical protein H8E79_07190 [Desulfobulbaceae bacterium]|uniref:Uncharacterized protein n=1 Tax=Candidatus Desulfatifera sulfidica TaxID=2841691 RepID=A0A8J6N8Q6_9BACT|nr:hypothetical protein [Candidatus Desulfatifera sulfidica]
MTDSTEQHRHLFLVHAPDHRQARKQVTLFMEHTQLIRYHSIRIIDQEIINGSSPTFQTGISQAIAQNRAFAATLVEELAESHIHTTRDLLTIKQGYPSKLLHILTHVLDGFMGPDSAFYNLIDDSHWLSPALQKDIDAQPAEHWLVPVHPGSVERSLLHT